jgi:pyridinium-3,5-biscarboxylic acid mononucleotide sulfurtransferase
MRDPESPGGSVSGSDAAHAGSPGDLEGLRAGLKRIGPMVVAFSGGADSAFLAWVASDTLGADQVRCVTAVSPSLAPEELADCRSLAEGWGLHFEEVITDELADSAYSANDGSRCFHCKATLMEALGPMASSGGRRATVVLGVNLDDLGDHRPGQQAAAQAGARFPLVEAGFTKADVRAWSRELGLRTWDKPAAACLASRVPYGTPVTLGTLQSVTLAESGLRAMGFRQLRVRHYGDTARIEVPIEALSAVVARRHEVTDLVHRAGYRYVTLDLDGFRSGNLNEALEERSVGREDTSGVSAPLLGATR